MDPWQNLQGYAPSPDIFNYSDTVLTDLEESALMSMVADQAQQGGAAAGKGKKRQHLLAKRDANSVAKIKACRERQRRERLNDSFAELAQVLEPCSQRVKTDKKCIIAEAVRIVTQLRAEIGQLKQMLKYAEARDRVATLEKPNLELLAQLQFQQFQAQQAVQAAGVVQGQSLGMASGSCMAPGMLVTTVAGPMQAGMPAEMRAGMHQGGMQGPMQQGMTGGGMQTGQPVQGMPRLSYNGAQQGLPQQLQQAAAAASGGAHQGMQLQQQHGQQQQPLPQLQGPPSRSEQLPLQQQPQLPLQQVQAQQVQPGMLQHAQAGTSGALRLTTLEPSGRHQHLRPVSLAQGQPSAAAGHDKPRTAVAQSQPHRGAARWDNGLPAPFCATSLFGDRHPYGWNSGS